MILQEKMGRKLVWNEEFCGDKIDDSKWTFRQSMYNSDAVYDNTDNTIRIEDGKLHMQVKRIEGEKPYTLNNGFTTADRMYFKYGYLEMRARIPLRHGAWPSFWLKSGTQFAKASYMAEIDIFEAFSSADTIFSQLHKWNFEGGVKHEILQPDQHVSQKYTFNNPDTVNDEYHLYAVEWDEKYLKFYCDDNCYFTYAITEDNDFGNGTLVGMAGFHDFAYVLMNNEIFTEHSWHPGDSMLTEDDEMPIDYYIDYVRLYQKEGEEIMLQNDIETQPHTAKFM